MEKKPYCNDVSPLINKFFAFYAVRMLVTNFINARHLSVSWIRSIPSCPSYAISLI